VHRLKTWTRREGTIRLSVDDGPPAAEFLGDDCDEGNDGLDDNEPLADRAERLRLAGTANRNGPDNPAKEPPSPIITVS
jgi:hypothetical protein